MFDTHSAQIGTFVSRDNLTTMRPAYIGENGIDSGADFGQLPKLENLFSIPLFSCLDRRIGARINLEQLAPKVAASVRVEVITGDRKLMVRPIDLSLTDISVASENAITEHGARVDIKISYNGIEAILPAIAALESRLYASSSFLFISVDGDEQTRPQPELGLIFQALKTRMDRLLLRNLACFMVSAFSSLMFASWIIN